MAGSILKSTLAATILLSLLTAGIGIAAEKPVADESPEAGATPGGASIFQPMNVDPALVRRSMQARAEYDRMTREINLRRTKLYNENEQIAELQRQMRELQEKIDEILAEDEVLKELAEKQREISPEMPTGTRAFPMGGPMQPPTVTPAE